MCNEKTLELMDHMANNKHFNVPSPKEKTYANSQDQIEIFEHIIYLHPVIEGDPLLTLSLAKEDLSENESDDEDD